MYSALIFVTSVGVSVLINPVPSILVKQDCHHFWDHFCLFCHGLHIAVLMMLVTVILSFVHVYFFYNHMYLFTVFLTGTRSCMSVLIYNALFISPIINSEVVILRFCRFWL